MTSNPTGIGFLPESGNANMARAIATAQQVAASDATVLLTGESGTGKHVLAHAIHGWSARCDRPFVTARPVHGGRPSNGELFGYFDQIRNHQYRWPDVSNASTLFIEEIGDLSAAQQAVLVRLLDERQLEQATGDLIDADIRVIAATSCDLDAEMRAGCFREDLHFRLGTMTIALPPLRDRQEDLPQLTDYFLAHLAARYGRTTVRLSPEVRGVFARYSWPGNVRELESILERGIVLSRGDTISIDELPERLLTPATKAKHAGMPTPSLRDMERSQIELAIRESATLDKAARRLGIDPATLWRKRKRYHLA